MTRARSREILVKRENVLRVKLVKSIRVVLVKTLLPQVCRRVIRNIRKGVRESYYLVGRAKAVNGVGVIRFVFLVRPASLE